MPTSPTHFVIDLPTLFALTVFILHYRRPAADLRLDSKPRTPALAIWGTGYLIAAAARPRSAAPVHPQRLVGLRRQRASLRRLWSDVGRRPQLRRPACHTAPRRGRGHLDSRFSVRGFAHSVTARIGLVSAITASYALCSVRELWYARDRELLSRWPTILLVTCHAGFLLTRIPFAMRWRPRPPPDSSQGTIVTVIAFRRCSPPSACRSCASR